MRSENRETIEANTYNKITPGYVIQCFNDLGECLSQEFVAGDDCTYEYGGDEINVINMPLAGREYQTFDMIQPN